MPTEKSAVTTNGKKSAEAIVPRRKKLGKGRTIQSVNLKCMFQATTPTMCETKAYLRRSTNNIGSEKNFAWKRKGEKTKYVRNA